MAACRSTKLFRISRINISNERFVEKSLGFGGARHLSVYKNKTCDVKFSTNNLEPKTSTRRHGGCWFPISHFCSSGKYSLNQDNFNNLNNKGSPPDIAEYIGQPIHATHPHLVGDGELTPGITKKEYKDRRHKLMSLLYNTHFGELHDKHLVIIPGNPNQFMSTDIPYPFRQNTDFLYLTGFQEPDAVLLLESKDGLSMPYHESLLFVRPRDKKREMWEGSRAGIQGAINIFGADEAYSVNDLSSILQERYGGKGYCIWYDHIRTTNPLLHAEISGVLFKTPEFTFKRLLSLGHKLHMLRLIKSPAEIALLRKSASVAAQSITKVMQNTRPGMEESRAHALMEYECRMQGADRLAYPPVVAGGALANTLHYINNTQVLRDGDLVLMDSGCEYHGYASDITRTWPVNGTFTGPQRELYDIVLEVQKTCISLCHKDITLDYLHTVMLTLLAEGLVKAGILPNNLTESQTKQVAVELCPHHVGHYLGMDVHDTHLVSRSLSMQPGMVVTIEPGLYINSNNKIIDKRYHGIGIRIEDDILITEEGQEVLSAECPKDPEEIEKLMRR
ncbi:xaa-Pro aminopeptidase 3 isoform X1 [Nematostella vectensis]|uniref:xaa-Pro aminopeptidase 3 isoform X1 n=1 Tax=Nematostella vectensis TaxID=45351 RepID=UPI0020777AFA|nr:xaa-Pro aminopeptidase 3 isoform X1 [Nematostella vectensis]